MTQEFEGFVKPKRCRADWGRNSLTVVWVEGGGLWELGGNCDGEYLTDWVTNYRTNKTKYSRINSTQYPASGEGMLASTCLCRKWGEWANSCARKTACSAVRAVEVPVLVCLHSSCSHVTEVGGVWRVWDPRWCLPRKMMGTSWM